jgi:hypothetical protein
MAMNFPLMEIEQVLLIGEEAEQGYESIPVME